MKKIVTLISLLAFAFFLSAADRFLEKDDNKQKKVLVVSFLEQNFESTYFIYEIAEVNNVNTDTVLNFLDDKIFNSFPKDKEFEFLKCSKKKAELIGNDISFEKNKKDILIPNLSTINNETFNGFLELYNSDYIIFINGFEMNWIGDPQYKVENKLHFTILGRDKKEITSSEYIFSTPKLVSFDKMNKKIQKTATKIYKKYLLKLK